MDEGTAAATSSTSGSVDKNATTPPGLVGRGLRPISNGGGTGEDHHRSPAPAPVPAPDDDKGARADPRPPRPRPRPPPPRPTASLGVGRRPDNEEILNDGRGSPGPPPPPSSSALLSSVGSPSPSSSAPPSQAGSASPGSASMGSASLWGRAMGMLLLSSDDANAHGNAHAGNPANGLDEAAAAAPPRERRATSGSASALEGTAPTSRTPGRSLREAEAEAEAEAGEARLAATVAAAAAAAAELLMDPPPPVPQRKRGRPRKDKDEEGRPAAPAAAVAPAVAVAVAPATEPVKAAPAPAELPPLPPMPPPPPPMPPRPVTTLTTLATLAPAGRAVVRSRRASSSGTATATTTAATTRGSRHRTLASAAPAPRPVTVADLRPRYDWTTWKKETKKMLKKKQKKKRKKKKKNKQKEEEEEEERIVGPSTMTPRTGRHGSAPRARKGGGREKTSVNDAAAAAPPTVQRGPGRPRNIESSTTTDDGVEASTEPAAVAGGVGKRGRGRPRKGVVTKDALPTVDPPPTPTTTDTADRERSVAGPGSGKANEGPEPQGMGPTRTTESSACDDDDDDDGAAEPPAKRHRGRPTRKATPTPADATPRTDTEAPSAAADGPIPTEVATRRADGRPPAERARGGPSADSGDEIPGGSIPPTIPAANGADKGSTSRDGRDPTQTSADVGSATPALPASDEDELGASPDGNEATQAILKGGSAPPTAPVDDEGELFASRDGNEATKTSGVDGASAATTPALPASDNDNDDDDASAAAREGIEVTQTIVEGGSAPPTVPANDDDDDGGGGGGDGDDDDDDDDDDELEASRGGHDATQASVVEGGSAPPTVLATDDTVQRAEAELTPPRTEETFTGTDFSRAQEAVAKVSTSVPDVVTQGYDPSSAGSAGSTPIINEMDSGTIEVQQSSRKNPPSDTSQLDDRHDELRGERATDERNEKAQTLTASAYFGHSPLGEGQPTELAAASADAETDEDASPGEDQPTELAAALADAETDEGASPTPPEAEAVALVSKPPVDEHEAQEPPQALSTVDDVVSLPISAAESRNDEMRLALPPEPEEVSRVVADNRKGDSALDQAIDFVVEHELFQVGQAERPALSASGATVGRPPTGGLDASGRNVSTPPAPCGGGPSRNGGERRQNDAASTAAGCTTVGGAAASGVNTRRGTGTSGARPPPQNSQSSADQEGTMVDRLKTRTRKVNQVEPSYCLDLLWESSLDENSEDETERHVAKRKRTSKSSKSRGLPVPAARKRDAADTESDPDDLDDEDCMAVSQLQELSSANRRKHSKAGTDQVEGVKDLEAADASDGPPIPKPITVVEPQSASAPLSCHREARTTLEELVLTATSYVASALKSAPWPSPHRPLSRGGTDSRSPRPDDRDSVMAHDEHMTVVGASLLQFARDVIIPMFQAAAAAAAAGTCDPCPSRVAVGTFLLLREVLQMNYGSIFQLDRSLFADLGGAADEPSRLRFVAKNLATSVVLLGIEFFEEAGGGGGAAPSPMEAFLQAAEAYASGGSEFSRYLVPLRATHEVPVELVRGARLDATERAAWYLTANLQRSRHTLLQQRLDDGYRVDNDGDNDDDGDGEASPQDQFRIEEPTVAHVTIVEEQRRYEDFGPCPPSAPSGAAGEFGVTT